MKLIGYSDRACQHDSNGDFSFHSDTPPPSEVASCAVEDDSWCSEGLNSLYGAHFSLMCFKSECSLPISFVME